MLGKDTKGIFAIWKRIVSSPDYQKSCLSKNMDNVRSGLICSVFLLIVTSESELRWDYCYQYVIIIRIISKGLAVRSWACSPVQARLYFFNAHIAISGFLCYYSELILFTVQECVANAASYYCQFRVGILQYWSSNVTYESTLTWYLTASLGR